MKALEQVLNSISFELKLVERLLVSPQNDTVFRYAYIVSVYAEIGAFSIFLCLLFQLAQQLTQQLTRQLTRLARAARKQLTQQLTILNGRRQLTPVHWRRGRRHFVQYC